jgi:hypothetical protein
VGGYSYPGNYQASVEIILNTFALGARKIYGRRRRYN